MSQFEQLKILYKQLLRLADEVEMLINQQEYNEALNLVKHKDSLLEKCSIARSSISFSEDEFSQIKLIENELSEKELNNINLLRETQDKVRLELNQVNKTLKLNSTYAQEDEKNGSILDVKE